MIDSNSVPFQNWQKEPGQFLENYHNGSQSFIASVMPEWVVNLDSSLVDQLLKDHFGSAYLQALDPNFTSPSPLSESSDPSWLKRVNMVGINIRTIGGYWEVIKYALTLPKIQSSIHLLPIWEPGVVSSLYGMASWNLNPEFFSEDLYRLYPHLDTTEKQLKVTINLLHLMGKTVGLDVIPHTDRYSEMVIANPSYFEWLWRKGDQIVDHRENLHTEIEKSIYNFLMQKGPAITAMGFPPPIEVFFNKTSEEARLRWLFGEPRDYLARQKRRIAMVDYLYHLGFEPVPATMGPPYRGLRVNPDPNTRTIDDAGRTWYDYEITRPQGMSRVFGPLTRYKLYDRLDDNQHWAIDFASPRQHVWEYVAKHFRQICKDYPFDFMRGDMSHVQMRPEGVPEDRGTYYDIHQYLKNTIRKDRPWFGYFAESFLAPPNTMSYGSESDHLEASEAESTLGDLQSMVVGSPEFMKHFSRYIELGQKRDFVPNFTVMTADKDDPRFDKFYLKGNEARLFIALFLPDLPSYMGLGFESRDPHPTPAPNEHYTKLYVFQLKIGPKATRGPYQWGTNQELFERLNRIRLQAEIHESLLQNCDTNWIKAPNPAGKELWIAWELKGGHSIICLVNLDLNNSLPGSNLKIDNPSSVRVLFSTHRQNLSEEIGNDSINILPDLLPGEGILIEQL